MNRMNLRKMLSAAVLIGGSFVCASALADPPQGDCGYGYGMGREGMMGGPGMMGDRGPGPGMMGGRGQGPGMMGERGPGPGMMGGPGMMDGQDRGYRMRPGMMNGYDPSADLQLTAEQRSEIAKIQHDVRRKDWDLMGKMQDEQWQMNELYNASPRDDAALSRSFHKMSDLRQQMFENSLAAQKQMDTVFTAEQREKLKHD